MIDKQLQSLIRRKICVRVNETEVGPCILIGHEQLPELESVL